MALVSTIEQIMDAVDGSEAAFTILLTLIESVIYCARTVFWCSVCTLDPLPAALVHKS
jgi:hypothetical protein